MTVVPDACETVTVYSLLPLLCKQGQTYVIVFVCLLPQITFKTSDGKISEVKMKEGLN